MTLRPACPDDAAWIEAQTSCCLSRHWRGLVADDARGIRAMVAFDAWTPKSCQAHFALASPVAWRHLRKAAFWYAFEHAAKQVVLGIVPAHNRRSLVMARHLGFRETHRVPGGWDNGIDLVVLEMRRADCRWLEN